MKDILYITLKVQAVSIQNEKQSKKKKKTKKKFFFTINGPAKTGQTGPLTPALIQSIWIPIIDNEIYNCPHNMC